MNIAVFDVCGTLYKENTTFGFLDSFFHNNKKFKLFRLLSKNIIVVIINRLIIMLFGIDLVRWIAIRFLKGECVKSVASHAASYVSNKLKDKVNQEVEALYNTLKDRGYSMYLMSGSLDFLVEAIAQEWAPDKFYSTKLEVVDGLYTGRIFTDQLYNKFDSLHDSNEDIESYVVVSDNKTDEKLFRHATKSYAICYKYRHVRFWNNLKLENNEIIRL